MRLTIGLGVSLAFALGAYSQRGGGFSMGRAPMVSPVSPMPVRPTNPSGPRPSGVGRTPGPWGQGFGCNRFGPVVIPYLVPFAAYPGGEYSPDMPYADPPPSPGMPPGPAPPQQSA